MQFIIHPFLQFLKSVSKCLSDSRSSIHDLMYQPKSFHDSNNQEQEMNVWSLQYSLTYVTLMAHKHVALECLLFQCTDKLPLETLEFIRLKVPCWWKIKEFCFSHTMRFTIIPPRTAASWTQAEVESRDAPWIVSLPGRHYFYCSACLVCGKALCHGSLSADSLCPDEVHLPWIIQTETHTGSKAIICFILIF